MTAWVHELVVLVLCVMKGVMKGNTVLMAWGAQQDAQGG